MTRRTSKASHDPKKEQRTINLPSIMLPRVMKNRMRSARAVPNKIFKRMPGSLRFCSLRYRHKRARFRTYDLLFPRISHVRGCSIGSLLVTRMYGEPFIMYGLSNGPDRGPAKRTSRTRCREHSFSSSLCYARVCGGSELRSRFDAHSVAQFWFALEMTQALRTKSPEPERQTVSRHATSSAIRSCIRSVLHPLFSPPPVS